MVPNLIIPGYSRTGTSWLYSVLKKHPNIFLPEIKEIHYFDRNYNKGIIWYEKFFEKYNSQKYILDITPTYVEYPNMPEKINKDLGNVKIIFIVRDPVLRIFSNFRKGLRESGKKNTFLEIAQNKEYLQSILYYENINKFIETFGGKNILVLVYEDMIVDKEIYIKKILNFLDLNHLNYFRIIHKEILQKKNATIFPHFPLLHKTISASLRYYKSVTKHTPKGQIVNILKRLYKKYFVKNDSTLVIDPLAVNHIRSCYFKDVRDLSKYLERDLISLWNFK